MTDTAVADLDARRRGDEGDAAERNTPEGDPSGDEPQAEAEPKPTPPMQIPLPGDWRGIGTEFGGRNPDTSEIRLLGGKMPIEGSFAKGTVIDLHVRVKVTGVLGQDTVDAFGQEESTIRRHLARMLSVRKLEQPPA
jgi:hypothetical protein